MKEASTSISLPSSASGRHWRSVSNGAALLIVDIGLRAFVVFAVSVALAGYSLSDEEKSREMCVFTSGPQKPVR